MLRDYAIARLDAKAAQAQAKLEQWASYTIYKAVTDRWMRVLDEDAAEKTVNNVQSLLDRNPLRLGMVINGMKDMWQNAEHDLTLAQHD